MPSRHISPQSFDEILSELGDDPAIPDPHGIRKPTSPKVPPKIELVDQTPKLDHLKKFVPFVGLGIGLIALGFALFSSLELMKSSPELPTQAGQMEIVALQKELALLREEILNIEDELYESIDSIEVSIHSLLNKRSFRHPNSRAPAIAFEAELRRWRYLGLSQIDSSQQVFFHNGKGTVMVEKGALLLGDWRLSHMDKEAAILAHPQGKSLTLKSSKVE